MPSATADMTSLERRMTSALKQLGERIAPLEAEAQTQKVRHDVVIGKLDGLSSQVEKLGDRAGAIDKRCDDLNLRLAVVETAWQEQMKPGLDRLRGLELKVAGAAVVAGSLTAIVSDVIRMLVQ